MEDKHKIYLDKVIEFLLRDTKIDYKNEKITTPSSFSFYFSSLFLLFSTPLHLPFHFSKYCKEVYGLTDQEIEYVWKEYKSIIKIKIENGR
jgi:hypothetical protein